MDTSPEYIKMCEKAQRELENFCPLKTHIDSGSEKKVVQIQGMWFAVDLLSGTIWLPHEFQLRKIAKSLYWKRDRSAKNIETEMLQDYYTYVQNSIIEWSREQTWLTFIMEKRYNKIWNGEYWQVHKTAK